MELEILLGWRVLSDEGENVDLMMIVVGALTMALMWGFAKGLEKL